MIKIHWTHLAIIVALVVGIFLGTQMQSVSSLAQAATDTTNNTNPYIAMTIYNNMIFIAKGNSLYVMRMVDHPFLKDQKLFLAAGTTEIDKALVVDSTVNFNTIIRPRR